MHFCTYCGLPADTIDHTIPQTIVKAAGDAGVNLSSLTRIRYFTVHACRECNSTLGDRVFPTLEERRAFVKAHIRRKYRGELKMPNWTDEELADVGPIAQIDIRAALQRRDWVRDRLAFTGTNESADSFHQGYRLAIATIRKGAW